MSRYKASPLSRANLQSYARRIRKSLGLERAIYLPVVQMLEVLAAMDNLRFNWEVVPDHVLPHCHAETEITTNSIRIRESVYDGACNGNGRDRMTIVHEICHFLLLCVSSVKLTRVFDEAEVLPYEDPEWQAKCMAGEMMIPKDLVSGLTISEVVQRCGVSEDAARYQMDKYGYTKRNRRF